MMDQALEQLNIWIQESRRMVFFGGAGVSTESGLKDFRGADGLYSEKFAYPPETMLSHDFFLRHTELFYDFYRARMIPRGARPNRAHKALARWEEEGKLSAVVTQNIDGLHQAAGSKNVLELHGSVLRNFCCRCGQKYDLAAVDGVSGVPKCACGGTIRPEVTLYGENLDEGVLAAAIEAISQADLLIVAGTSLTVYPAAGLVEYYPGCRLALINRDPTPQDGRADLRVRGSVGQILGDLAQI